MFQIAWAALPPVEAGHGVALGNLGKFMARNLLKVLREDWLSGLGYAGLIFDRCKSMGRHCCGYREGGLDPDFISFADRAFSGCLSKCLWCSQQVGLYSKRVLLSCLWDRPFKWLIAPGMVVFIQIVCPCKRFNLLELISYSCWNTSKCSARELSKLSPHGACWEEAAICLPDELH